MISVRPYRSSDSIAEITELLHRAYAPLLAAGMRFVASYQDDATTLERIQGGACFVAEEEGRIVGTVTVYNGDANDSCEYYRRPDVMYFGQFGVDPAVQGGGIGRLLLKAAEDYAQANGAAELALDTSERATDLIALYSRWGFEIVGTVDWNVTNYVSVLMAKKLPRSSA